MKAQKYMLEENEEMLKDIRLFKQDPSISFEYKYLTNAEKEQQDMRRTIMSAKNKNTRPEKPAVSKGGLLGFGPKKSQRKERPAAAKPQPAKQRYHLPGPGPHCH